MNKAILMGRLTRDPELKMTGQGIAVCSFTVAVNRRYKNAQGERDADFIQVVAWRNNAEFVNRYFHKGKPIIVVGSIQTRSWDDESGQRRYATEVVADEIQFVESDKSGGGDASGYARSGGAGRNVPFTPTPAAQPHSNGFAEDADEGGFMPATDDDPALPFDMN